MFKTMFIFIWIIDLGVYIIATGNGTPPEYWLTDCARNFRYIYVAYTPIKPFINLFIHTLIEWVQQLYSSR